MSDLTTVIALTEQLTPIERLQLLEYLAATLRRNWETSTSKTLSWPEFIEQTAGSLQDDPIQRWPQGEFEKREMLE